MNKDLKYFKNVTTKSADLYIYGAISDEKMPDWWTGEESKTEIDTLTFKEEIDSLNGVTDLNIYINSPGGSVFASSTMCSLLQRLRDKGTKIHSFVDGLCASAATYLLMFADDINIYQNSMLMIHKPMSYAFGNANEMQKEIDTLNAIENELMIPMYMKKAKVSEEEIKNFITNETWFGSKEIDKNFNVNLLTETKEVVACTNKKIFQNYKNIPEKFKNVVQLPVKDGQEIDYSHFENAIEELRKEELK